MRNHIVLVAAVLLGGPALHADKIDLDRTDPVPASQTIPTSDFFRDPLLRDPRINSTGTELAALLVQGDRTRLLVWDIARKEASGTGGIERTDDVKHVEWLDDKHMVFTLTSDKHADFANMIAQAGDLADAYPLFQYWGGKLIAVPLADPDHPLFWLSAKIVEGGDLFTPRQGPVVVAAALRPTTGAVIPPSRFEANFDGMHQVIAANQAECDNSYPMVPGTAVDYLADHEGKLEFGISADDSGTATVYRLRNNDWVRCPVDLGQVEIRGVGDEPGQLIVLGPREPGKPRLLHLMDAESGKLGDELISDDRYDFDGTLFRDPGNGSLVGAEYDRQIPTRVWFNDGYAKLQKVLDGTALFKGKKVDIISLDKDASVIVVSVYSDREPANYFTVELAHKQVGPIKNSRPWIEPGRMRPMSFFRFKTRDGASLDAYATLPAGANKDHPVPMIVLPHADPFGRDTWGFQPEVQYLASLGYAVLQPNYRASGGNSGQMADDLSDAIALVARTHLVDPKRIAIVGSGFGGYLALASAARNPSVYRCAVTIGGISDWAGFVRDGKFNQYSDPGYSALKRSGTAISGAISADQLKAPVFVYHEEDDPNVSVDESRHLISALGRSNAAHEEMIVGGDDSGRHHLEDRVAMWDRVREFLQKNL